MSSPRTADVDTESPGDGESNIAGLSSSKTQTSAISATTESHVDNSGRVTLAPTSEGRRHSESTATEAHISRSPLNVTNGHTTNSRPVPSSPAPQLGDNHHPSSSSLKQKGLHSEVNSPNKKPLESQLSSMAPRFQASPASNGTAGSTKLDKEIARLNEVLAQTSAEAAQRILRQHWRIFLFDQYNEDHISFILRAGLKNSNFSIIERVFKDEASFKDSLISVISKKRSIIANVLKSATYGEVLDLMSESVLDRALSERLKHVPAKELIRWLAEADRLGYSLDDILDEEDESVLPNVPSRPQTSDEDAEMTDGIDSRPHVDLALPYRDTLLAEQERNAAALRLQSLPGPVVAPQLPPHVSAPLACLHCHQNFNDYSGYNYHMTKKVCLKETPVDGWKWACGNCYRGFTTKQGRDYHIIRRVCCVDYIARATSPSSQLQQEAAAVSARPPPISNPILPPVRPTFTTQPRELERPVSTPHVQQPRPIVGSIPRPPLHTPGQHGSPINNVQQQLPPGIRQSPSELNPVQRDQMDRKLKAAEERFRNDVAAIPESYTTQERNHRITSLKQANATRKSQIRKAFGVTLRMREKDKAAALAAMVANTPPSTSHPRLKSYRAPPPDTDPPTSTRTHSSSAITTGFAPINAPSARNGPSPPNKQLSSQMPLFRGSQLASTSGNTRPSSAPDDDHPASVDFGVLHPDLHLTSDQLSRQNAINRQTATIYALRRNAKRRRTSASDDSSNNEITSKHFQNEGREEGPYSSGLSMTQVRAEDVVSKINAAKVTTAGRVRTKVPVGAAQARWEALQPRSSGAGVLIAEAPTGPQAGRGTREEAIVISSNESDAEVEKPIESDEFKGKDGREIVGGDGGDGDETEDEEERIPATAEAGVDASSKQPSASVSVTDDAADGSARSASVGRGRGRFMAKRGGHGRH